MGDVIHVNFRPDAVERLAGMIRDSLREGFDRRGFERSDLADWLADEYAAELRALDAKQTLTFTCSQELTDDTRAAIGAEVRRLGAEAMLSMSKLMHLAAIATAEAACGPTEPSGAS